MILCCGEALIDMLPRRTEAGEDAFAPYAGGAVFNTAVALGRLGAPSGFLAGLSTDLFGEMLAGALRDNAAASLIGEVTAGRGTLQRLAPLADGPVLRLTVARWRTPGGSAVDGIGIEPERVVTDAAEQLEAATAAALAAAHG